MALMASSPLPIEADAETLEAAQKDSVAPKAPSKSATQKKRVSTVRVQEVRAGRWKKFRAGFGRGKRKAKMREEVEMDDWMFLMNDQVMLNRATMRKFGIRLGEVTLSFRKR